MRVGISIFVTLFVFFVDPFGLKSATNDQSVEIYSRAMSGSYSHAGQDRIAVALMTDKAAEDMAGGYPVPLRVHGEVVAAILCAGARSVFIDINFRWERLTGDAEEFIDALRMRLKDGKCVKLDRAEVKKHPVQVILGHVPSRTAGCDPIFPEFNDPAVDCKKASATSPFAGLSQIATVISLPEPKTDLRYQLSEPMSSADKTSFKFDLRNLEKRWIRLNSPAAASLLLACDVNRQFSPLCDPSNLDLEATLVTRWGWEVSRKEREMKRWLKGTCVNEHPVATFMEHRIRHAAESGDVCMYHDTMAANDIRAAVAFGSRASDPDWPRYTGDFILEEMFKDRFAFYGIQITGVGDYVRSPTLGRVSGVYAHAMALDNLLTEQDGFWREPGLVFANSTYWNRSLVIELILGIGLLLAGWRVEERNDADFNETVRRRDGSEASSYASIRCLWRSYDAAAGALVGMIAWITRSKESSDPEDKAYHLHRGRKWLFLLLAFLVVVGIARLEMHWWHWPPNDWIVLFTLILAAKPGHRKYDEWTDKKLAANQSICLRFQKLGRQFMELLRFGR